MSESFTWLHTGRQSAFIYKETEYLKRYCVTSSGFRSRTKKRVICDFKLREKSKLVIRVYCTCTLYISEKKFLFIIIKSTILELTVTEKLFFFLFILVHSNLNKYYNI